MPRPKDAKIWNEDLIAALEARYQKSLREGKRDAHTWRVGREKIESVRRDIYQFRTGSIVNLPTGLTKKVQRLCENVIRGVTNVYPDGHVPTNGGRGGGGGGGGGGIDGGGGFGAIDMTGGGVGFGSGGYAGVNAYGDRISCGHISSTAPATPIAAAAASVSASNNPYTNDHYMRSMKIRGGAFAILMAFHHSQTDVLRKAQICQEAQRYCDDQMDSNYHAGRMYGAWKAIDTLKSHHLVTEQGFATHTGRGFRDRPHEYTLTRDGKMFIEALMANRPEAAAAARQAVGGGGGGGGGGAAAAAAAAASPFGSPFRSSSDNRLTGTLNPFQPFALGDVMTPGRSSSNADVDRAEFERWVASAKVGDHKDFKVGKERRKALHRLCDALQENNPGLLLTHSSTGTARQRILSIRVVAKSSASAASASAATGRKRALSPDACSSFSKYGQSFASASSPATKRSRELTPAQNAALAAMRRQEQAKEDADLERAIAESAKMAATPPRCKSSELRELENEIQEIDGDDDEEAMLQRAIKESLQETAKKPPAGRLDRSPDFSTHDDEEQKKPCVETYNVGFSDSGSDSDDELLRGPPIFSPSSSRQHKEKHIRNDSSKMDGSKSESARKIDFSQNDDDSDEEKEGSDREDNIIEIKDSQDEPIDLLDSQPQDHNQSNKYLSDDSDNNDDVVIVEDEFSNRPAPATSLAPNTSPMDGYSLTFMIDNRERNKNATPRTLRIELTRHLTSGPLKQVWPRGVPGTVPPAQVEEVGLDFGDFGYRLTRTTSSGESRQRIGVSVERKRVNDLVQRSYDGDHLTQLFRMQQYFSLPILLVEYDTRMASRLTAYNAQDQDTLDPFDSTITCEEDVYRMFGRVILCSNTIKFLQTKDEQASLRAIGALGLMAASAPRTYTCELCPSTSSGQCGRSVGIQALSDLLKQGGIPWRLGQRVARAIGGIEQLAALYQSCCTEEAKSKLLSHLMSIKDEYQEDLQSSPAGWSDAVFRIMMAHESAHGTGSTNLSGESALLLHKDLIKDHGTYLSIFHSQGGCSPQEALDRMLSTPVKSMSSARAAARSVMVQLTSEQAGRFFPSGDSGAFYKLSILPLTEAGPFPSPIIMRTVCESLASKKLRIYELEGSEIAELIRDTCDGQRDCIRVANEIASRVDTRCQPRGTALSTSGRRILLVCGMQAAMDCIAKKPKYRPEMRTILDMVFSDVLVRYNITIVQALRKNEGDRVSVVRQLALACYHYAYLVERK